jgi:hypothetical protein
MKSYVSDVMTDTLSMGVVETFREQEAGRIIQEQEDARIIAKHTKIYLSNTSTETAI